MALIVADRVRESSTTTGTGTLTLSGSPLGYQTFSSAIGNGNTTYYAISNPGVNEWEVGIGTVGAGTLARTTVLSSSTGTSLVNFTAGNKDVFCTYPAEVSVFSSSSQTLTNKTISVDDNTVSGIAASSFVVSNASGNIDGTAAQKVIPTGAVVGTTDTQTLTNKTITGSFTGNVTGNVSGTASNVTGTVAIANGGTGATTATTALTNLGGTTVGSNFFKLTNPSAITFPRINADNTVTALNATDFRTAIGAGTVTSVGGTGTVSGLTLTGTVTSSGNLTLGGTLAVTPSNFASQTAYTVLAAPEGSAGTPTFRNLTLMDLPGAWVKKSVDCATTAALTINTAQTTIDGVTLSATSRVLVKDQASAAQNGIYTGLTTTTWVRAVDADTAAEIAGACVNVDAGTTNGGLRFDTDFKSTDTLGTTAMSWYRVVDRGYLTTVGNSFATLTNPSAVTFPRINADNTITALARQDAMDALAGATTSGQYLRGNGTDVVMSAIQAADVPTLNQNTTGTAAGLSSTLVATSGGTGQSAYAVGDLLYASSTTALSRLADVATGNALISGGVGVAPSWGKVGLTTHVSGTLPLANGGTNATTAAQALINLGERTGATGSTKLPVGTTAQRDASPAAGYIRFNSTTNQYEGYNGTAWLPVGGGATGAGGDQVFLENGQTVTTSYTLTTGKNAVSAGPITINDGVTVTIPTGAVWTVV